MQNTNIMMVGMFARIVLEAISRVQIAEEYLTKTIMKTVMRVMAFVLNVHLTIDLIRNTTHSKE